MKNKKLYFLLCMVCISVQNVQGIYLIPERDQISPQQRNYTVYVIPEISFTSVMAQSYDYTLSYNYQMNASHIWVTFAIPESLAIDYRYKVFIDVLNSYGDTIANATFKFIIAEGLTADQLWALWDKYAEYEEIIADQNATIGEQNDTIGGLEDELGKDGPPKPSLEERILPFLRDSMLFISGALMISFVAFLGVTKLKKKLEKTEGELNESRNNFRSEMEQNRTGSLSLLATKPDGRGRPIPILTLLEEQNAVKKLRDDPELSDFLQVVEANKEKTSLDHLKNLFNKNMYTTIYKDKIMFQYYALNGIIRYCYNYGYTGEEGTLYPKGCSLGDLEVYSEELYYRIRQHSDIGKYVPIAEQEEQLKQKVKRGFGKLPDAPNL